MNDYYYSRLPIYENDHIQTLDDLDVYYDRICDITENRKIVIDIDNTVTLSIIHRVMKVLILHKAFSEYNSEIYNSIIYFEFLCKLSCNILFSALYLLGIHTIGGTINDRGTN